MKILILSPHTDDEVLGAGGSIARWIEEGHDVIIRAFTNCGVPILEEEFASAAKKLGVSDIGMYPYNVRQFNLVRQNILDVMIYINTSIQPDLVLVPSKNDVHQDHQVITNEAIRAFKHCSILGYEMPWNNYIFETDYFIRLESKHIMRKCEALAEYKSQSHRPYCTARYIESHAHVRGMQVKHEYAETFQLIRWIH